MTLHELLQLTEELLKIHSGDTKILISSDEEGNTILDLSAWGSYLYLPDKEEYCLIADEDKEIYSEEEIVKAIGLWPN